MVVAILSGVGLLIGIGSLSLLSGAFNFLFIKPKLEILKSKFGNKGFAFSFMWDQSIEKVKFDRVRIQLFNPFGSPKQLDIIREFDGAALDFARDLELGQVMEELLLIKGIKGATIEIEVSSSRDNVSHKISMKGDQFIKKQSMAAITAEELNQKLNSASVKPRFEIPERTFISPPLPKSAKALKIATNPEFANAFAGGAIGTVAAVVENNFSVLKVWIEPGCIVCDACEAIYPEVFEVTDSTCIIRPGAPLFDGLKIQESAEACPVEVIKFTKAG